MSRNDLDCMHIRDAARYRVCTNFSQASHACHVRASPRAATSSALRSRARFMLPFLPHWCLARWMHCFWLRKARDEMHKVNIPQSVVNRVIERCGTAHPHAPLDPARTALVVIDLQNGFM